jgi:hypothetical protein
MKVHMAVPFGPDDGWANKKTFCGRTARFVARVLSTNMFQIPVIKDRCKECCNTHFGKMGLSLTEGRNK